MLISLSSSAELKAAKDIIRLMSQAYMMKYNKASSKSPTTASSYE